MSTSVRVEGQAIHPRWDMEIRGPSGAENADLRIEGTAGRILLEHQDSAFQRLLAVQIGGGHIAFALARGGWKFDGIVNDTVMSGTARNASGAESTWLALPIPAGSARLPVPPRITVRQLLMGADASVEQIPGAWLAAVPDSAVFEREYRDLVTQARMVPVGTTDRAARARLVSLGLDESGRQAVRSVLERIATRQGDGAVFRSIFMRDGRWKIDIHDAVLGEAPHYLYGFALSRAADGLRLMGELDASADSSAIRQAGWRLWCALADDTTALQSRLAAVAKRDDGAALAVRALIAGYDDTTTWWRRALSWLLTHAWLDTPDGPRSPAQLMARFWGVDSLPIPDIRDHRFGDFAALPIVSVRHIARSLFVPANAIAVEWLTDSTAVSLFRPWRSSVWGGAQSPLAVQIGSYHVTLASPAFQGRVHPAAFFGDRDEIELDPGIVPLAAVATFLHEWNHLLMTERRLAGLHPKALRSTPYQLQVREDDPWLSEGFAEWATEQVLRPAGVDAAFLRFTQVEKRLAIAAGSAHDPHVLGYELIRAAAQRMPSASALRDSLADHLHDLSAMARLLGFGGPARQPGITLQRPATAVLIPEITFTWVEGTATNLSRRLVLPASHSEP